MTELSTIFKRWKWRPDPGGMASKFEERRRHRIRELAPPLARAVARAESLVFDQGQERDAVEWTCGHLLQPWFPANEHEKAMARVERLAAKLDAFGQLTKRDRVRNLASRLSSASLSEDFPDASLGVLHVLLEASRKPLSTQNPMTSRLEPTKAERHREQEEEEERLQLEAAREALKEGAPDFDTSQFVAPSSSSESDESEGDEEEDDELRQRAPSRGRTFHALRPHDIPREWTSQRAGEEAGKSAPEPTGKVERRTAAEECAEKAKRGFELAAQAEKLARQVEDSCRGPTMEAGAKGLRERARNEAETVALGIGRTLLAAEAAGEELSGRMMELEPLARRLSEVARMAQSAAEEASLAIDCFAEKGCENLLRRCLAPYMDALLEFIDAGRLDQDPSGELFAQEGHEGPILRVGSKGQPLCPRFLASAHSQLVHAGRAARFCSGQVSASGNPCVSMAADGRFPKSQLGRSPHRESAACDDDGVATSWRERRVPIMRGGSEWANGAFQGEVVSLTRGVEGSEDGAREMTALPATWLAPRPSAWRPRCAPAWLTKRCSNLAKGAGDLCDERGPSLWDEGAESVRVMLEGEVLMPLTERARQVRRLGLQALVEEYAMEEHLRSVRNLLMGGEPQSLAALMEDEPDGEEAAERAGVAPSAVDARRRSQGEGALVIRVDRERLAEGAKAVIGQSELDELARFVSALVVSGRAVGHLSRVEGRAVRATLEARHVSKAMKERLEEACEAEWLALQQKEEGSESAEEVAEGLERAAWNLGAAARELWQAGALDVAAAGEELAKGVVGSEERLSDALPAFLTYLRQMQGSPHLQPLLARLNFNSYFSL